MEILLITGGAGSIGSNLARMLADTGKQRLVVFNALTYAGNLGNIDDLLATAAPAPRH